MTPCELFISDIAKSFEEFAPLSPNEQNIVNLGRWARNKQTRINEAEELNNNKAHKNKKESPEQINDPNYTIHQLTAIGNPDNDTSLPSSSNSEDEKKSKYKNGQRYYAQYSKQLHICQFTQPYQKKQPSTITRKKKNVPLGS